MGRVLVVFVVLAICVGIYGANHGWFATTQIEGPGTRTYSVTVDEDHVRRDRAEFEVAAQARLQKLDDQIRDLNTRAASASADAKVQWDLQAAQLRLKWEAAKRDLQEERAASNEKWADAKARMSATLDDIQTGLENAFSRFK